MIVTSWLGYNTLRPLLAVVSHGFLFFCYVPRRPARGLVQQSPVDYRILVSIVKDGCKDNASPGHSHFNLRPPHTRVHNGKQRREFSLNLPESPGVLPLNLLSQLFTNQPL